MTQTSTAAGSTIIDRCYAILLMLSATRERPIAPPADTRGEMMGDDKLRGLVARYSTLPRCAPREQLLKIVRAENLIERTWAAHIS